MRYRVKFDRNGKTVYGIMRGTHDREAAEAATRGNAVVEDAVLPEAYEVPDSILEDVPFSEENDEYDQYVAAEYRAAEMRAEQTSGVEAGAMFHIGVADGFAAYVVTKVNKRTCKVEWRGFCLDRYVDHHFGYGGTFPIAEINRYVALEQARIVR